MCLEPLETLKFRDQTIWNYSEDCSELLLRSSIYGAIYERSSVLLANSRGSNSYLDFFKNLPFLFIILSEFALCSTRNLIDTATCGHISITAAFTHWSSLPVTCSGTNKPVEMSSFQSSTTRSLLILVFEFLNFSALNSVSEFSEFQSLVFSYWGSLSEFHSIPTLRCVGV